MSNEPRIAIGMPVYNGAPYVEQAVRSLLQQTERNFVLLISDDCSTDETPEICAELAAEDHRIQFVRQDPHLGMTGNFNYVMGRANAEFFMLAAQDDLWEPDFIEESLSLHKESPGAVGAMTAVGFIEADGSRNTVQLPRGLSDADPGTRARSVNDGGWYAVYGLLRTDLLPAGINFEDVSGPDMAFVFGLALHGRILTSGRVLSTRRVEGYEEVPSPEGRLVWQKALGPDGHLYARRTSAMCRLMLRYTWGAPLSSAEKVRLSGHIAHTWWLRALRNNALHDSQMRIDTAREQQRYGLAILLTLRHAILRPTRALSEARLRLSQLISAIQGRKEH